MIIDAKTRRFERRVLLLVTLVQFINIWDFMIVMPLGPDFAHALGIDATHIGWVAGSYSIAAAVIGLLTARYLDRFDRRSVLLFNLGGMAVTTLAMVLANTLSDLIMLRVLTGIFGGPVIASSLAIIADVFPDTRRGEAVGKVFGSFSMAAVLGVPLGLEIARLFGWWAPFVAISVFTLITMVVIRSYLPPMRQHLDSHNGTALSFSILRSMKTNKAMLPACIMTACTTFAAFLLIPNISAFVQQNMVYPREWLGLLYFSGGLAAFFSMRYVGRKSDKLGFARTGLIATLFLWICVFLWFYQQVSTIPSIVYFIVFMVTMSTRNVTSNALISKIPHPYERAGFMSIISATQHLMSGLGAMCSTVLLWESADGRLLGVDTVAIIAMLAFAVLPWMMVRIEQILAQRH